MLSYFYSSMYESPNFKTIYCVFLYIIKKYLISSQCVLLVLDKKFNVLEEKLVLP